MYLCDLHTSLNNYSEIGNALIIHQNRLSWSDKRQLDGYYYYLLLLLIKLIYTY